jgi:hypothetical protein
MTPHPTIPAMQALDAAAAESQWQHYDVLIKRLRRVFNRPSNLGLNGVFPSLRNGSVRVFTTVIGWE